MSKNSWDLSEDEVRQIGRIVETLNQSSFDYLQMEVGTLKVSVSKGALPAAGADATAAGAAAKPASAAAHAPPSPLPADTPSVPAPAQQAAPAAAPTDGTLPIVASLIGRIYLQPEPGAPPFVRLGSEVSDDATVALIEVMKTFNAVCAGVRGVITEICVQDAALVEYGQVLFRVRPRS